MNDIDAQLADLQERWAHGHAELTADCALCRAEYAEAFDLVHQEQP